MLLLLCVLARAASPSGYLDTLGDTNATLMGGWATDPDYSGALAIHIYVDGSLVKALVADQYRADVGDHAWGWVPPSYGAGPHEVIAYAIGVDASGTPDGDNVGLLYSPQTFNSTCDAFAEPDFTWCRDNPGYWYTRQTETTLIGNNYVRAGINTSYGGAIFQLYDDDWQENLVAEHGGAAIQLSVWGYDETSGPTAGAYFRASLGGTGVCDPTLYPTEAECTSGGYSCTAYGDAYGAHVSDCVSDVSCLTWSAGAPWNPIQAQAESCGWESTTNDVDVATTVGDGLYISKSDPWQFTKTTALEGLDWEQWVTPGDVYLQVDYALEYAGPYTMSTHPQEIPAIFTSSGILARFYHYDGEAPYSGDTAGVQVIDGSAGVDGYLQFPGRTEYGHSAYTVYGEVGEGWWTACDDSEEHCLTVATFSEIYNEAAIYSVADGSGYITALGYFGLVPGLSETFTIYLFPYRYDAVVDGESVLDRIYALAADAGFGPESCNGLDDDGDGAVDEEGASGESTWYLDADGDGYGTPSVVTSGCDAPVGYVTTGDDCDDARGDIAPGALEVCDGVDNTCDGAIDEAGAAGESPWYPDADGDGHGTPLGWTSSCSAPAGYVATSDDCDDARADILPGATEVCDGVDNNCDAAIDEGTCDTGFVTEDSGFIDTGTSTADSGTVDTGTSTADSGTVDTGTSTADSGTVDTGIIDSDTDSAATPVETADTDSGTTPADTDTGSTTAETDTGSTMGETAENTDSGVTEDTGNRVINSGSPPADGCSCTTGPSPATWLALLGLVGARRRGRTR